jgi:hypothetical protein
VLVTRAAFLRVFGLAFAGVRLDPAAACAPSFRVDRAEPSHFQALIGDSFAVRPQDGSRRRLTLARISERPHTRNVAQFSLVFDGPMSEPIADGIHRVEHPALGSFEIFIAGIARSTNKRRRYEACFSRYVRT